MALEPIVFPWETRIITDFNQLLPRLISHYSQQNTATQVKQIEDALAEQLALSEETSLTLV